MASSSENLPLLIKRGGLGNTRAWEIGSVNDCSGINGGESSDSAEINRLSVVCGL